MNRSNPFQKWKDDIKNLDYRFDPTQNESYVRNILNEDRFLTNTYRVNAGKEFVSRALEADNTVQKPAMIANSQRWGFPQNQNYPYFQISESVENLNTKEFLSKKCE